MVRAIIFCGRLNKDALISRNVTFLTILGIVVPFSALVTKMILETVVSKEIVEVSHVSDQGNLRPFVVQRKDFDIQLIDNSD